MSGLQDFEKKVASIFGVKKRTVGKTQARKDFFPLVDQLDKSKTAVEITDHDKPVAVLIGYEQYLNLMTRLYTVAETCEFENRNSLLNSIELQVDDLEEASREISKQFENSIQESMEKL